MKYLAVTLWKCHFRSIKFFRKVLYCLLVTLKMSVFFCVSLLLRKEKSWTKCSPNSCCPNGIMGESDISFYFYTSSWCQKKKMKPKEPQRSVKIRIVILISIVLVCLRQDWLIWPRWTFIHSHFLCENLNGLCADYLIVFWDLLIFSLLLFSKAGFKRSLNTRKPFKNNVSKWKAKQSWKGNVRKNLFLLSTFFTWGRK